MPHPWRTSGLFNQPTWVVPREFPPVPSWDGRFFIYENRDSLEHSLLISGDSRLTNLDSRIAEV
jgi:hypothetical protein